MSAKDFFNGMGYRSLFMVGNGRQDTNERPIYNVGKNKRDAKKKKRNKRK